MNDVWLGIDTSNYTTSVAAIVDDGKYYNLKMPLLVKENEVGLRQSDAVFAHTKNIHIVFDDLMKKLKNDYGIFNIKAIGVSSKPRPILNSYMPCFLVGRSLAFSLSSAFLVPVFEFSHQEGHIRAALFGAGLDVLDHFYSFHISGGTCELLEVNKTLSGFEIDIISQSLDITLGQLVDRIGVRLGLPFPCGANLERLAEKSTAKFKVRILGEKDINLSGFENMLNNEIQNNVPFEDVARHVYDIIISSIKKMISVCADNDLPIVFAGGVSGSNIVKREIQEVANSFFSPSSLSSDNAVGISILAKENFLR